MRKDTEQKNYCNVRDYTDPAKPNATPIPKFVIGTQHFNLISGSVYGVEVEHKKITPKTGLNAGKEITVHNLLIDMIDENGTFCLQLDLYSQIARSMLNVLAGDFDFNQDMYLGVYKNKADYRTLSIKKGPTMADAYIDGKYTFDEMKELQDNCPTIKVKGEDKKDYDGLMDRLVEEFMPIIQKKLESVVPKDIPEGKTLEEVRAEVEVEKDDPSDLPF